MPPEKYNKNDDAAQRIRFLCAVIVDVPADSVLPDSGYSFLEFFLFFANSRIKKKNKKVTDALVNMSAACSLRATDNIMRIAIIPAIEAAAISMFFIVGLSLSLYCCEVFSVLKSG